MFHSSKFGTQAGQKLFGNQQLFLSPPHAGARAFFYVYEELFPARPSKKTTTTSLGVKAKQQGGMESLWERLCEHHFAA